MSKRQTKKTEGQPTKRRRRKVKDKERVALLIDLRKSCNKTSREVATNLGMTMAGLYHLEHNKIAMVDKLKRYATVVGSQLEISFVFPNKTVVLINQSKWDMLREENGTDHSA